MIAGLISVGTNSTRALVANIGENSAQPLLHDSIGTRIGEGLEERGEIAPEPMQRTLDAIAKHAQSIRRYTGDMRVIATSAVRRAGNAEMFAQRVRDITGAELQIVSGEDEARYSYLGALRGLNAAPHERVAVADVGGGSTEYALGGAKAGPERIVSCEIGAVRLTQSVPKLAGTLGTIDDADMERAHALASEATAPIAAFDHVERLIFVGGTASAAIALLHGTRDPFTYAEFSRSDVERIIALLRSRDLPARRAVPAMNPQRADILLAGLVVVRAVFEQAGHELATVSTSDLLMGFLVFGVSG